MRAFVDLDRYPLDHPKAAAWQALVGRCRADLEEHGLCNLPGFLRQEALQGAVDAVKPILEQDSFLHTRRHNIYFKPQIEGLAPDHPCLAEMETSNRTICADQMGQNAIIQLYEWPPFAEFLAAIMGRERLFPMADPLARVNVMGYGAGQALNWHFDRSEFTTTLLMQAPEAGGAFEYCRDLRSEADPNYDGIAALLTGKRPVSRVSMEPGTLNVFKGKNTAHRVTPVRGAHDRIIAVFSYFDQPDVVFSEKERIGFYGRAG